MPGRPFLSGLYSELGEKRPGMMTLVGLAITVAYVYSSAVVFGLEGRFFFWELATLVDVMLAGHWIEMRSVLSASSALEERARLMPDTAHRKRGEELEDVPLSEVEKGDVLVIKPGERIPALTAGLPTLIAWFLVGRDAQFAIERMATVMVITWVLVIVGLVLLIRYLIQEGSEGGGERSRGGSREEYLEKKKDMET